MKVSSASVWVLNAALLGCSGASWRSVDVKTGYQPPRAVNITMSVAARDTAAGKALADALVEELSSHGIEATVTSGTTTRPQASLSIVRFDPGSRGLRWVGLGGGKGTIVVEIAGTTGVEGAVDGFVRGGFFGGAAENSAIAAGHLIGETIATGHAVAADESEKADHDNQ